MVMNIALKILGYGFMCWLTFGFIVFLGWLFDNGPWMAGQ